MHTYLNSLKICLLFILFAFIVSGCALLPQEEEPLAPPLVEPAQQKIELAEVVRKDIKQTIEGTAVFEPVKLVYQQFREGGGRVEEIFVNAGDYVNEGDPLIRLSLDDIDLTLKQRQLEVEKLKIELQNALQKRDEDEIRIKKLELDIANIKLADAQAAYDSRHLYANMSGEVVYLADIEPGDSVKEWVPLVNIADPSAMRLFYSGNRNLYQVEVGMKVDVTYNGQTFEGTVVQTPSTAPTVTDEILKRQYDERIYIELEQIPENAQFGDYADIYIVLKERKDTLVIPSRALRTYMGREYVQILDGESRKELDVETGIKTSTEVEILQGLEEGQMVILQ